MTSTSTSAAALTTPEAERDARHERRHPGRVDADHRPLGLGQRVVAREQRADVRVGPEPDQHQVEARAAGLLVLPRVLGGAGVWAELARHAVHDAGRDPVHSAALTMP